MKTSEIILSLLKIPCDYMAATGGMLLAYLIRERTDLIPGIQFPTFPLPPFASYSVMVSIAALLFVGVFAVNRMYTLKVTTRFGEEISRGVGLIGVWLMLLFTYFFLARDVFFSRLVLFYGTILTLLFFVISRFILRSIQMYLLHKGIGKHRVLFIGHNPITTALIESFSSTGKYECLGVVQDTLSTTYDVVSQKEYAVEELEQRIMSHHVDEVVQTTHMIGQKSAADIMLLCRMYHVRYRYVPEVTQLQASHIEVSIEAGIPLIELLPTPLDGWKRVLKRGVDILGAACALVMLSPLWIATAIAVWIQLGSWKHIIFRQRRLGYHGRQFFIYKFQSMVLNAEKLHEHLLATQSEREGLLKIKDDPRVTPVGKFIRKTSLDELPQLLNVLNGTMSLVGPRPHMPSEVAHVSREYYRVLTIKPGITGLSQISGRSSLSFEEEIAIDLAYLEQWSLASDVRILLGTVRALIKREHAS